MSNRLNAKQRLLATATVSLSLREWKLKISSHQKKVKFVKEDGSKKTSGEIGDVVALDPYNSSILGVYSYTNEVCWFSDEDEDFQEFSISSKPPLTRASLEDPTSSGVAFEALMDGAQDIGTPLVQMLTKDDGGIEPPDEQHLLNDDLPL